MNTLINILNYDFSSFISHSGTFKGHIKKIDYLKISLTWRVNILNSTYRLFIQ